jgi:hypothetical protein
MNEEKKEIMNEEKKEIMNKEYEIFEWDKPILVFDDGKYNFFPDNKMKEIKHIENQWASRM